MDVLNAELKWIGDSCYRVLRVQNKITNEQEEEEEEVAHSSKSIQDDEYDPALPILHKGNKFYITIHVPAQLIGIVVGKQRKTQKAFEQQYGAKMTVPDFRNAASEGIVISGSTKKAVSDLYRRIEGIVFDTRRKTEPTHFISLPMNSPEIKQSFLKFKNEVLEKYKSVRGIDESIFQNPHKLHVTITPLVLLDERDNENAIAIFKNCMDKILANIGDKEFIVCVKGVEYMNDDPAEVDVLYAKLKEVDDDNRIQIIADSITEEFVKANLAKSQHDKVKLHITIMNTLFRGQQDENSSRITFDARRILKDFDDYDFGKFLLSEIHLSVMHSMALSDKYYIATHKIKLNK